ncbi:MAG: hypothetical protein NTW48_11425 [Chloroflexi bacterium]|nr:hypothetical protein [Chloroflexota bacterium]
MAYIRNQPYYWSRHHGQLTGTFHVVPSGTLVAGEKYGWNMQAHGSGGGSVASNTLYFQTPVPLTVSARIDSYSPSSRVDVAVGSPTPISVTFTNTGNTVWSFIAGAIVWDSAGNQVANYSQTLYSPLQPGQQTTVSWNHPVNQAGDYWLQFGIYLLKWGQLYFSLFTCAPGKPKEKRSRPPFSLTLTLTLSRPRRGTLESAEAIPVGRA